jgi:hypothetical protein
MSQENVEIVRRMLDQAREKPEVFSEWCDEWITFPSLVFPRP